MVRRDPSPEALSVLDEVRANTDVVIAAAKRACWRDRASTVKADGNGWKLLAAIEGKRRSRATIVRDCRKSDQNLADDIVKHYVAKNRNFVKSEDVEWRKQYLTAVLHARNQLRSSPEFSPREIQAAIRAMPTHTATGPDAVEVAFLHHLSAVATHRLLDLINRSWRDGVIPAAWREVLLIGVPKPSDPTALRPISLSSMLNRVAERLIGLRLTAWIESKLPPDASGIPEIPQYAGTHCSYGTTYGRYFCTTR